MLRYSIGIDIGANGGIVIQDIENNDIETFVIPKIGNQIDTHSISEILKPFLLEKSMVAFEDLNAIHRASAGATFKFGFNAGVIEGIVIALGLPYRKVHAKVWQKEAFAGIKEIRKPSTINKKGVEVKGKLDTKAMALISAKRLYPNLSLTATKRSKKDHDGIVDALLISWWVIQNYK